MDMSNVTKKKEKIYSKQKWKNKILTLCYSLLNCGDAILQLKHHFDFPIHVSLDQMHVFGLPIHEFVIQEPKLQ